LEEEELGKNIVVGGEELGKNIVVGEARQEYSRWKEKS
jgi:hypothetical protein